MLLPASLQAANGEELRKEAEEMRRRREAQMQKLDNPISYSNFGWLRWLEFNEAGFREQLRHVSRRSCAISLRIHQVEELTAVPRLQPLRGKAPPHHGSKRFGKVGEDSFLRQQSTGQGRVMELFAGVGRLGDQIV